MKRNLGVCSKESGSVSTIVSPGLQLVPMDTDPTEDPLNVLTLIQPAHQEQENRCMAGEFCTASTVIFSILACCWCCLNCLLCAFRRSWTQKKLSLSLCNDGVRLIGGVRIGMWDFVMHTFSTQGPSHSTIRPLSLPVDLKTSAFLGQILDSPLVSNVNSTPPYKQDNMVVVSLALKGLGIGSCSLKNLLLCSAHVSKWLIWFVEYSSKDQY